MYILAKNLKTPLLCQWSLKWEHCTIGPTHIENSSQSLLYIHDGGERHALLGPSGVCQALELYCHVAKITWLSVGIILILNLSFLQLQSKITNFILFPPPMSVSSSLINWYMHYTWVHITLYKWILHIFNFIYIPPILQVAYILAYKWVHKPALEKKELATKISISKQTK